MTDIVKTLNSLKSLFQHAENHRFPVNRGFHRFSCISSIFIQFNDQIIYQ